jgi:hypothetical protein
VLLLAIMDIRAHPISFESDPRQLICERDCQNVTMQTPRRSREPGSSNRASSGARPFIPVTAATPASAVCRKEWIVLAVHCLTLGNCNPFRSACYSVEGFERGAALALCSYSTSIV